MKIRTALARVKRSLFKKPFLKDKSYPPFWLEKMLGGKEAFVVQIGSNDGKTGDPLHTLLQNNKKWHALFVEPVPYAFEKLKENYADSDRFLFENVAINEGQQLTFYWVDPKAKSALPDLPYWYDQLGSFDKTHILKHFDGALEPYICSAELEGLTLPELLKRNTVTQIDVLHIDTEGYDWKILSQLDLTKFQPGFILYEYHHLSEKALNASFDFLNKQYVLFKMGIDVLAVNKDMGADTIKAMSQSMSTNFSNSKTHP